jgi:hypothetical protein
VSIIRSDPKLKRMTPKNIFAGIINHELLREEARYVKNLSTSIVSTKKDVVALKDSKKSKEKQTQVESSSEEEHDEDEEDEGKGYDEEEMKFISKRRPFKGRRRRRDQRGRATIVARMDILLPNVHMREKMKTITRKRRRTRATRRTRNSQRRGLMDKLMLVKNGAQVMRVLSRKVMTWQP